MLLDRVKKIAVLVNCNPEAITSRLCNILNAIERAESIKGVVKIR